MYDKARFLITVKIEDRKTGIVTEGNSAANMHSTVPTAMALAKLDATIKYGNAYEKHAEAEESEILSKYEQQIQFGDLT